MTASTTNSPQADAKRPKADGQKTLDEVRLEIDSIDDAMHDLLMRRADLAAEVAAAKARDAQAEGAGGFIPFRPKREIELLRRLAGRNHGALALGVVSRIWREIVAFMSQIQGPFRAIMWAGGGMPFWELTRNGYGSTVPVMQVDACDDIIDVCAQDPCAVGVLPWPAPTTGTVTGMGETPWWLTLSQSTGVRVVMALPVMSDTGVPEALSVAQAEFEATDADTSLLVVKGCEGHAGCTALSAHGLSAQVIDETDGAALLMVEGYVVCGDARLLAAASDDVFEAIIPIGGYAHQVRVTGERV